MLSPNHRGTLTAAFVEARKIRPMAIISLILVTYKTSPAGPGLSVDGEVRVGAGRELSGACRAGGERARGLQYKGRKRERAMGAVPARVASGHPLWVMSASTCPPPRTDPAPGRGFWRLLVRLSKRAAAERSGGANHQRPIA